MKRIVVVGGGFAGLHLLRRLERRLRNGEAQVTLVDRNNYHLFTPLLYQVATGELPPHAVAYPLRQATAPAGFDFLLSEVEHIDVERRAVRTADGDLAYDHLVICPGSVTNDYGIQGVREHALFTKDLADAQGLRRRLIGQFERAVLEPDPERRRALLSFVIIGAGPVGVELAASMRDLMERSLRPMYPQIDLRRDVAIRLIDASDRVIAAMDPRLSRIAERRLLQLGIELGLNTKVRSVGAGEVSAQDGMTFRGGTVIWAGGVKTHPLVAAVDLRHAKDGRLMVDEMLRAGGRDDVICLGDAAYREHQGKPLAQLAQVAVIQAPQAADNLVRAVRGQPLLPYRHRRKGDLIALGRTSAGAHMGRFVFGGLPAWSVWRVNYLMQLLGVRNRATLLMEWTLSFFVSRMISRTP